MRIGFIRELVSLRSRVGEASGTPNGIDRLLEGLLKTFGKTSSIGIYVVENGRIQFANTQFQEVSGYSESELIGMNPSRFIYGEDLQSVQEHARQILKGKRHRMYEYRLVGKNGCVEWVIETFAPIWRSGNDQSLIYFVEINVQRRTEETLQEMSEYYSNLLTSSLGPVMVINPDMSIKYVNPALEKLTGFFSGELLGRKPPYPWWPKGAIREIVRRFESSVLFGQRGLTEFYRNKDDEPFVIKADYLAVKNDSRFKYCVSTWVDITEEKRLADNMQFYIAEVIRAQEEERRRIARELHDSTVQELAMVCADCAEMCKDKNLPVGVSGQLKRIRNDVKKILEEVRGFSHDLRPGILDQFGLLPSLELLVKEMNRAGDLKCSIQLLTSEQRMSPEAELQLFRITQEALRNVRKHAQATEVVINIEFTDDSMTLSIIDNGVGFNVPGVLSSLARRGKLGLLGMNERTNLLGGRFQVKSYLGKGTKISVQVPVGTLIQIDSNN